MHKGQLLEYRKNKMSYNLGILAVYLNFIYIIITLNTVKPDFVIGGFTLIEIFLSLVTFLACAKIKLYSKGASYYLILFGIYQLLKLATYPARVVAPHSHYTSVAIALLIVSGIVSIISGYSGIKKSKLLDDYFKTRVQEA